MRRVLLKVLFLATSTLGTSLILVFSIPDRNDYTHAIIDKHRLLDTTSTPRIIFAGGSGLAFGLDSQLIQDSLGRNVINMGLHGPSGLRFHLEQIRPSLQPTDIVVLIPEYVYYYGANPEGNASVIVAMAKIYPRSISYIKSIPEVVTLLGGSARLLQSKCTQLEEMILHIEPKPTIIDSVYVRNGFNDHGDLISHLNVPPYHRYKGFYRGQPETQKTMNPLAIELLNDFALSAKEHGARVYLLYPAIIDSIYAVHEETIRQLDKYMRDKLNFEILCSPSEYTFPGKYFFDSIYHLNGPGRHLRTLKVIAHLRRKLS